jgi:hypothetical protein
MNINSVVIYLTEVEIASETKESEFMSEYEVLCEAHRNLYKKVKIIWDFKMAVLEHKGYIYLMCIFSWFFKGNFMWKWIYYYV